MLHDGRMVGLVKLRRSARPRSELQFGAGRVQKGEYGSQLCSGSLLRFADI